MTLLIHSANRVETLQHNLTKRLTGNPLSDPFAAEVIIVPTFAMSRWLNLQLARQQGIATNIDYPSPTSFLWQLTAQILPNVAQQDPLQLNAMSWQIFTALPELIEQPSFQTLRDYLTDDSGDIKHWQLSIRIAAVFERYQQYRPKMIQDWSRKPVDDWQSILWHRLIQDLNGNHRVALLGRLIDYLNQQTNIDELPERISLFAISSLPPLFIEVIHALSEHTEISLYQHSPTDQYWADLKNQKSLSRLRLQDPESADHYETRNELIASWGRQGQIMQDLLLEQGSLPSIEIDSSEPPGHASLLHSIQQSIFDLETESLPANADQSLSVHSCHSPLRECQVLHNRLLSILKINADLNHEDILVMVPDISRYAPYIEAVFGQDDNQPRPYLPWNLSDTSVADEHPLVQSFLQLLDLPNSRFENSAVMSLLEIDEIRRRFEIDDQALSDIHDLLDMANLRWGIDAEFKQALGLPAIASNTWQQARHRAFAGYALGAVDYWNGIAPLAQIDASRALNLGKFWRFFDRLEYWRDVLTKPANAREWISRLNHLIDDFFATIDLREDRLQQLRDSIDELNLAQSAQISADLLRHWIKQLLSTQQKQGRLFSGGISFCGMRPMRNLPFPVICLLGMNDADFPRRTPNIDFDKMANNWQPGDPRSSDEDRYLMLETLLCARQILYISYCGRSLKDNSEQQPSVLVQELLDFIDTRFDTETDHQLSHRITQVHPMQVFSAENYYSPNSAYDKYWCEVARQLTADNSKPGEGTWPLKVDSLQDISTSELDLIQLQRFLRHPIKYFFNMRFKIYLNETQLANNDETFSLDSLEAWGIKSNLADSLISGTDSRFEVLQAEGKLPHGPAAIFELEEIKLRQKQWLEKLQPFAGQQKKSRTVQCKLKADALLFGEVRNCYSTSGLMHFTASKLKGHHLLALWVDHLVLCASSQLGETETSLLIADDKTVKLNRLDANSAIQQLGDLSDLYHQGQRLILPIFPDSSYAFASQSDPEQGLREAQKAWAEKPFGGAKGDSQDNYIQLALRSVANEPLLDMAFADYAQRLYRGLLENIESH